MVFITSVVCVMDFARKLPRSVPVLALAIALAACGSVSDPQESRLGTFLVAPGKYQLYDCVQLAQQAAGLIGRERELREAKAKAEAAPGGALISSVAYGTEYGQLQGNLAELRREVIEKKCDPPPPDLMPRPTIDPAPRR